jgi:hypothetical protein
MQALSPQVPQRLDELAREVLEALRAFPESGAIVLGGGVALQHYCEFRDTRDLDAWWADAPDPRTQAVLQRVLADVGRRRGMTLVVRSWGETQSYELQRDGKTVFSFQIAVRTRPLAPALPSAWAPVQIEAFEDNMGAKMNALVGRGAPRDFLDVYEAARRRLATEDDLWEVWGRKNPTGRREEAETAVLRHLELIEARRPLAAIDDPVQRARAEEVRRWVRERLCRGGGS